MQGCISTLKKTQSSSIGVADLPTLNLDAIPLIYEGPITAHLCLKWGTYTIDDIKIRSSVQ